MEHVHPFLQYLATTSLATVTGVLFWITLENLEGHKYRYILAITSFLLLSPLGGWVVSWFIRMSRVSEDRGGTPA